MNASRITLRPAGLLLDVEDKLSDRSREVVNRCKDASKGNDPNRAQAAIQEAETLWPKHREQLGHVVALLWLVDWHLRKRKPESAYYYAKRALDHMPLAGPLPEYTITKAVAQYMLGRSHQVVGHKHQISDHLLEAAKAYEAASYSYQEMFDPLKEAMDYWQRVGDSKRAGTCDKVLRHVKNLEKRVSHLHSRLSAPPPPQPPPSPLPRRSRGSRAPFWVEFTQLPVIQESIPAGAPRDLTTLLRDMHHDSIAARQLFIENKTYRIEPLYGERRVRFTSGQVYVSVPVIGDSMVDVGILENDYVVLRLLQKGEAPHNDNIVAVETEENQVTLKQYVVTGGRRYLQARNQSSAKWGTYNVQINDNLPIWGIAIAILKPC